MKVGDIELFLHLFGVISVFVGFGTLLLATIALAPTSRVEQVRAIMAPLVTARRVGLLGDRMQAGVNAGDAAQRNRRVASRR